MIHTTKFPSPCKKIYDFPSEESKVLFIAEHFKAIMEALGLDLSNDSLAKTPLRVATMYVHEIFSGLHPQNFPSISFMENKFHTTTPIYTSARFYSFCEHHFVPMNGTAFIAYLPKDKVIGLSKIPRIVRYFARRPQIQERLTSQIADCLSSILETENVAVLISAEHFCVKARGIQDDTSLTTTSALYGQFFEDPQLRQEFYTQCK